MSRVLTQLRFRLRWLFRPGKVEQELDEELQYHLDREIEESLTKGMAPEEARLAAFRALGAITQNKEECRDMLAVIWIRDLMRDLHYGARALRNNLTFSVVGVLALALGIGANTAMFSLAYGIVLRPLPYADGERLAAVYMTYGPRDRALTTMSIRDYLIGIYGLIAYWVAQRTHEIGVRMALGALQSDVMRMVVREGVSLAAIGIAIGLGGAVVLTRFLETMLFGIDVTDSLTFVAAPFAILLVVLLATFVPAFRATQVSPVIALRYE